MSSYGNRTKNQQEVIQNIIRNEIGYCQSALVDMLLQRGDVEGFTVDDIQGMYIDPTRWAWETIQEFAKDNGIELPEYWDEDGDPEEDVQYQEECIEAIREWGQENPNEPLEWWPISSSLARNFAAMGEVTIDNDYGYWWGRRTSGQSIELDGIWDTWIRVHGIE